LDNYILASLAWRSLSLPARCTLIELLRIYNGTNNGQLGMAVRYLAERLNCSKDTASRALNELEEKGFIRTQKVGVFGRPMGSEYNVTMRRNDVNSDPPSNEFMRWKPDPSPTTRTVPVSAPVRPQGPTVRPRGQSATKLQEQSDHKDSKGPFGTNPSPCNRTHIHLTMGVVDAASRSAPIGSAVASEAALHGVIATALQPMPFEESAHLTDGNHGKRALTSLWEEKFRRSVSGKRGDV
jgi:hypothetical protein